jgi:large conductance mechanosensitive channel
MGENGQDRAVATRRTGPMLTEFREFILRGNLVDLAVAVVIGTVFTALVTSMVEDLFTR